MTELKEKLEVDIDDSESVLLFRKIEKECKKIEKKHKKISNLKSRLCEHYKCVTFQCKACKAKNPLGETAFVRTHWYTRPSGCTDGDYWSPGEAVLVCMSCGCSNRILSEDAKNKFENFKYQVFPQSVYKECLDEYDGIFYIDGKHKVTKSCGVALNIRKFVNI